MQIRCERCSTVYELDERVLPAGGAPVQCTRCQHVFHAWPPQAAGRTLVQFPAAAPSRPPGAAPGALAPAPPSPARPAPAAPSPAPPGAAPRRKPPEPPRPPEARRGGPDDTVTMFARKLRARARWGWLGPLLLLVAGGAAYGAWAYRSRLVDPAAVEKRGQGLRLLLRDDAGSLEQAAAAFAEAGCLDPRLYQARADRALALLFLAADRSEEAAAISARLRALEAELSRIQAEGAEGWERRKAEVAGRLRPAQEKLELLQRKAGALSGEAIAELRPLVRQHGDDAAVARALALSYALEGNADQAGKALRNARAPGRPDPWLDLAEGVLDLATADSRAKREQAVARIGPLAGAHPEMLRARVLLARAQAQLAGADAAVATLDGVLAVNPGHERARRLKEELLAPPAAGGAEGTGRGR